MKFNLGISVGLVISCILIPIPIQATSLGPNGEYIVPFKASLSGAWPCAELGISMAEDLVPLCADDDGCVMRLVDMIDSDWPEQDWVQMSVQIMNPTISILPTPYYLANTRHIGGGGLKRTIGDQLQDILIATPDDGFCSLVADVTAFNPDDLVLKACIENSICTLRVSD